MTGDEKIVAMGNIVLSLRIAKGEGVLEKSEYDQAIDFIKETSENIIYEIMHEDKNQADG